MLYGRQEILLPECPDGQPSESGYAIFVVANFRFFRLHHRNLRQQIAWVLYGQASRAISIG